MERTATWTKIGTDINDCKDINSVLEKAHLNYEVSQSPIIVPSINHTIENRVANIDSFGNYKGIVSPSYTICQNKDAFDFVDSISSDLEYVKAGETKTGLVYVIGKLPGIEVLGDVITPYIILQNSHNGKYNLKSTICPLRIVCQNQFNISFKETPNSISIKHSRTLEQQLIVAKRVMSNVVNYMDTFKEEMEKLYNRKVSHAEVMAIFDDMFKKAKEEDLRESQKEKLEIQRSQIITAYNADDNQNFKGTVYGLLNAFTDFNTHKEVKNTATKNDNQFYRVTFDNEAILNFMKLVDSKVAA